jgi:hypothetical protein
MIQSRSSAETEWISVTWKPRLVNTPVPIMLAITSDVAV